MRHALVSRYRKVVSEDDTVYFLGDLTLAGISHHSFVETLLYELPGRKIMILGNHDKLAPFTYENMGFESIHTALEIPEGYILRHDPVASITRPDKIWLCGHVHTHYKTLKNIINVGVDVWDFYPISIVEIQRLEREMKKEE